MVKLDANYIYPMGISFRYDFFMNHISVKYPTITCQKKIGDKLYVLETIRDLDEAIDLICESLPKENHQDPFAEDLCPYFGILWPSALALSRFLAQYPELIKGKKVLELGCGLGLPAIVSSHLGGEVLATDFHPDVEEYFLRNCRHSSVSCDYKRLNWREFSPSLGLFDVVIGSDILYESKHPQEVAKGLLSYLKSGGKVILSDPGRAYLQNFVHAMKSEGVKEKMSFLSVEGKDIFIFEFSTLVTKCTE